MSKKNSNPARSGNPVKRAQSQQSQERGRKRNSRTLFLQVTVFVLAAAIVTSVMGSVIFTR